MSKRTSILITIAAVQFMIVLLLGVAANVVTSPASANAQTTAQVVNSSTIPAAQAAQIAQQAVSGATLDGTPRLVNLQGTTAYQVSLSSGVVYVNATTGQILHTQATASSGQSSRRSRRSGRNNNSDENSTLGQED